jgi:hypothetical protein
MNLMGANIPYPYDVPDRTTKSRIGYWSIVGFMEKAEDMAKNQSRGGKKRFQIDGTKGG